MAGDRVHAALPKVIPVPPGVQVGRWWRRGWTVALPPGGTLAGFALPAPPDDLGELPPALIFLTATDPAPAGARLEILTPVDALPWNVLVFVAVVISHLNEQAGGGIGIDGRTDHPLLRLAADRPGQARNT